MKQVSRPETDRPLTAQQEMTMNTLSFVQSTNLVRTSAQAVASTAQTSTSHKA